MSNATAIADKMPRRRRSVDAVISESGLPTSIGGLITNITRQTRLWKRERTDVAIELVAHFRDGIDAGRTADELIRDFGDTKRAAKLIRRAKRRNRPWWWQVQHRLTQALVLLLGLVLAANIVNMIRFYSATPTIRRNYVAEVNTPILAIPADQRAVPVYQRALTMLVDEPATPDDPHTPVTSAADRPGEAGWPLVAEYLKSKQDALAVIRQAASMPALGAKLTEQIDPAWTPGRQIESSHHDSETPLNGSTFHATLGHITALRRMETLLRHDAYLAIEEKQSERAAADIQAVIGIARHNREIGLLLSDLSSISTIQWSVLEPIKQFVAHDADVFTDEQLIRFAHLLASFASEGGPPVRLDSERISWDDLMQRIYTDNGHGDGHITADGYRYFQSMFTNDGVVRIWIGSDSLLLAPLSAAIIGNRAELSKKYHEMLDQIDAEANTPMWQRGEDKVDAEIESMYSDAYQRTKYMPISLLMPALSRISVQSERYVQNRNAVLVMIAVELHKRRMGSYPASLNELVPLLLPAIPLDRFDGQPLRYSRTSDGRYTIYSVGTDLDDDGGRRISNITHEVERTEHWVGQARVDEARRSGDWSGISEGDWVLFPPEK